jgi:hypothetical protein
MLPQTSTKKMFQLPRSVTCLAQHLLHVHQAQKQATKIEEKVLVAKLHELAARVEFIVDCETGLSSTV